MRETRFPREMHPSGTLETMERASLSVRRLGLEARCGADHRRRRAPLHGNSRLFARAAAVGWFHWSRPRIHWWRRVCRPTGRVPSRFPSCVVGQPLGPPRAAPLPPSTCHTPLLRMHNTTTRVKCARQSMSSPASRFNDGLRLQYHVFLVFRKRRTILRVIGEHTVTLSRGKRRRWCPRGRHFSPSGTRSGSCWRRSATRR